MTVSGQNGTHHHVVYQPHLPAPATGMLPQLQPQQGSSDQTPSKSQLVPYIEPRQHKNHLYHRHQHQQQHPNHYCNFVDQTYANAGIQLQENLKHQKWLQQQQQQQQPQQQHLHSHPAHQQSNSQQQHAIPGHNHQQHSPTHHHHHHHQHHAEGVASYEFLPLCDLLFNIISLAAYFCDVLFDIVRIYSLYSSFSSSDRHHSMDDDPGHRSLFLVMMILVISSSLISQYLSIHWFARSACNNSGNPHLVHAVPSPAASSSNSSQSCSYDNNDDVVCGEEGACDRDPNDNQGLGEGAHRQQQNHPHNHSHRSSCGSNHTPGAGEKHYNNSSSKNSSSQHIPLPIRCKPRSSCLTAVSRKVCSLCRSHMTQVSSLNWSTPANFAILMIHVLQLGILWRYFRLFVPVNLLTVKHEVRDLCMLRMVHGFCEAAPMLLIQVYLMCIKESPDQIRDLDVISTFLSLFAVCWALAAFNKNARRKNIHKLILTWLGVIFQFFWRIGMISSRVVALTVYAIVYHEFVFAVILLHWICMILWILSPTNLFYGEEKISRCKRFFYSVLVGYVYIFCYINLHENNARPKMIAFYFTMFIENTLLASVSIAGMKAAGSWFYEISILLIWGGFGIGLLAMILYYKFFHIRFVKQSLIGVVNFEFLPGSPAGNGFGNCPTAATAPLHYSSTDGQGMQSSARVNVAATAAGASSSIPVSESASQFFSRSAPGGRRVKVAQNAAARMAASVSPQLTSATAASAGVGNGMMPGIPGVFNCRLNPALKRKKKKPSSFVPPPPAAATTTTTSAASTSNHPTSGSLRVNGHQQHQHQHHHQQQQQRQENQHHHRYDHEDRRTWGKWKSEGDPVILSQVASAGSAAFMLQTENRTSSSSNNASGPSTTTATKSPILMTHSDGSNSLLISARKNIPSSGCSWTTRLQPQQQDLKSSSSLLPNSSSSHRVTIDNTSTSFFRSAAAATLDAQNRMNHRAASGGAMSVPTVSTSWQHSSSSHLNGRHRYIYYQPRQPNQQHASSRLRQRLKYRSQTPEVLMRSSPHNRERSSRFYYDYPGCIISSPPPLHPPHASSCTSIAGYLTPHAAFPRERGSSSSSSSDEEDDAGEEERDSRNRSSRQHHNYEAEQFYDRHFHPVRRHQKNHHRTHHYSKIKLSHSKPDPRAIYSMAPNGSSAAAPAAADVQNYSLSSATLPDVTASTSTAAALTMTMPASTSMADITPISSCHNVLLPASDACLLPNPGECVTVTAPSATAAANVTSPSDNESQSSVPDKNCNNNISSSSFSATTTTLAKQFRNYKGSLLVPSCKRSRKPIRIGGLDAASITNTNNSSSDADIDSDLNVDEQ